jgi:hypothetical protein
MPARELLDLDTTADGDIQIGYNGDLLVCRNEEVVGQEVLWRAKTVRGDWILEPDCGADLETLIGLPNTPETGAQAEALLSRALTHDGFVHGEVGFLRAVPVNRDEIALVVNIDYGENNFTEIIPIDLKEGVI